MIYKVDNLTYVNLAEVVAIKAATYKTSTRQFCDVNIVTKTQVTITVSELIEPEFHDLLRVWANLHKEK